MAETLEPQRVVCRGGLSTNGDTLTLSDEFPGMATRLLNYEVSQQGGYRRIDGYAPYGTGATLPGTGATLGCWIYDDDVYGARAATSGSAATYDVRRYITDTGWTTAALNVLSTGSTDTRSAVGVTRIRVRRHNFTGTEKFVITDGVNYPAKYDGTTWSLVDGTTDVLAAKFAVDFKNHMAYAGMTALKNIVVISAPNTDDDFSNGSGTASINVGFTINGLAVFREFLYVFGVDRIKRIVGNNSSDFKLEDVTSTIGCVAPDSIAEVGGDVLYLSYDGVRKVSGTERIGDVDLETISENVKSTILTYPRRYDLENIISVVVRSKTQFRYLIYEGAQQAADSIGLVGGVRYYPSGQKAWEFGDLLGIQANCADSGFIAGEEIIIHGGKDGAVYRQENGDTSFNGSDIVSVYRTPYLDQGNTETHKDYNRLHLFVRAEGPLTTPLALGIKVAWDDPTYAAPVTKEITIDAVTAAYNDPTTRYGASTVKYGGLGRLSKIVSLSSSGPSIQFTFVHSSASDASFSIQGFVLRYIENEMAT